ncbi:MAG: extracellular solute-binding protein [Clostridiaceae bacterium]|nr:extracellular solute-binding protein [Clostridiaceae bacterium]
MKINKVFSIIAIFLVLAMLAGCTGASTSGTTAAATSSGGTTAATTAAAKETTTASNINPAGELPIVKEPVELEILIATTDVVLDYATNEMTKKMEDLTNVKIKWTMVADANESKSLLLASGDLPDIFRISMTPEELSIYGNKGVFIDLSSYIEQYGVNIKKMFDYDSTVKSNLTIPSGKIVSMPTYSKTYHMTACNKLWVDRNWLTAVGKEVPKTIDEFYDMLVAFKNEDPNGNKTADEIPLTSVGVDSWNSAIGYIMSAFITTDNTAGRYFVQPYKGKVDVVFNKAEWRQGLTFLNKLYTEGLLDAECFTQDAALRKQKVESGVIGATVSNAPSAFSVADSAFFKAFDAVAPLTGPNGLQSTAYIPSGMEAGSVGFLTITNACKNPDVAFRWVDLLYSEDLIYDNLYGNEGKQWRYATADEVGINGQPAIWKTLEGFTGTQQNISWYQNLPTFRRAEWRLGEVGSSKENYLLRVGMETRLYDATKLYEPYYNTDVVPHIIYIGEDIASEYADIKTALYDYMYLCTARFITGDMSIEKDWDSYLAELSNIGLENYIKMTQEALDSVK